VFFYRKDLFGAKGLTPPKTLAELEPLAKKLHAPPATYGIVLRGLKNANATQYPSILFPMGGTYLKERQGRARQQGAGGRARDVHEPAATVRGRPAS